MKRKKRQKIKLSVTLIPRCTWGVNVRSMVPPEIWDMIRYHVYARAHHVCEVCGVKARLECHERWYFNNTTKTQKLTGLVALCSKCHEVKHFGRTKNRGRGRRALKHFMQVNNMTSKEANRYINRQFRLLSSRSKYEWTVDIGHAWKLVDRIREDDSAYDAAIERIGGGKNG